MLHSSEGALEESLIQKLVEGGYKLVKITDENELKRNFKSQLEKFNNVTLEEDEYRKVIKKLLKNE